MSKFKDLQLTGQNGKGDRRELDFYPTPANVTIALLDFIKLDRSITIWEPANGNGAMSKIFTLYGYNVITSDIRTGEDFLQVSYKCDAIITNPPFNLSTKFIEKAVNEAPIVAMLLKSQYWHAANRLQLFRNMPPTWVLPLTWRPDFLEHERTDGSKGSPTMEVGWSVWLRGNNVTKYYPLEKPFEI